MPTSKSEIPELKVNLGCGTKALPDWINIDITLNIPFSKIPFLKRVLFKLRLIPEEAYRMRWPRGTVWHDIRRGLPFDDNTVDYIYSAHFLEHMKKAEAVKVLIECHRVLKKGGLIRIVVPDLEILAQRYNERDTKFFESNNFLNPAEKEKIADAFLKSLNFFPRERWQRMYAGQYHLWMYDFDSLYCMLGDCGFKQIEKKNPSESQMPDIKKLDERSDYNLCLEARK
jgi:predicted SAM-dependent methyltransferase